MRASTVASVLLGILLLAGLAVSQQTNAPANWKRGDTLCDPDFGLYVPYSNPPGLTCLLIPADEVQTGGRSPEAQDGTYCSPQEGANVVALSHLNTSIEAGKTALQCGMALRFSLDTELPPNVTVRQAIMFVWTDWNYYQSDQERRLTFNRNLVLRNIMGPWDEDTATLANFAPGTGVNSSVLAHWNRTTHDVPAASTLQDFGQFAIPIPFDVTTSAEAFLRGYATHRNGWFLADEGNGVCAGRVACKWVFFSSAARNAENKPRADCFTINQGDPRTTGSWNRWFPDSLCWPGLRVSVEINRAVPSSLKFSTNSSLKPDVYDVRRTSANPYWVSGLTPWNMSVDVNDEMGRITRVAYEFRNETGVVHLTGDLPLRRYNRTDFDIRRDPGDRSVFWAIQRFAVPEGKYYVNLSTFDNDGNRDWMNMSRGNPVVWVDNTPPRIDVVKFPTEVRQHEPANFTLNVTDPRKVDHVSAKVTMPSGFVEIFKMKPAKFDWSANRTWFEPGVHKVVFRANDTLGNVNETALEFRVLDTNLPTTCAAMPRPEVVAPAVRSDAYVQEEGGPVTVRACADDETDVSLEVVLTSTGGTVRRHALRELAGGVWNVTFAAPSAGRHDGRVVAKDADGNVADIGPGFHLDVEPRAAPQVSGFVPGAGAWANGSATISAVFRDVNLDRATIRMDVSVGDGPFERATPQSRLAGTDVVALLVGRSFSHGDVVTVRASANDTVGNSGSPVSWSFRVDTRAPRLTLTPLGPRAAGPVASYVTRDVVLNASALDDGAGVARVEARWANVDAKLETPWLPVTGEVSVAEPQVDRGAGLYAVSVRAVDAVGNEGLPEEFRYVLDPDAPTAALVVRPGSLVVDAADGGAGLRTLVVGARLLGDPVFRVTDLSERAARQPQGGRFEVDGPVVRKGETLEWYLTAEDALGNRLTHGTALSPVRHLGANHPPTVEVDAPENGTEVKGGVDVAWRATDDDGDSVRVDVEVRPVVLAHGEELATRAPARGAAGWDSRSSPDGVYVLAVTARDGEAATRVERTFVVNNTGTGLGRVVAPGERVEYLGSVRFEVTLYRPVVDARLVVRDARGDVVGEHELRDDGLKGDRSAGDGVFTATYPADRKGAYSTDVEVVYADAGTVVVRGAAVYQVQSSFANLVARNFVAILLAGVVLVGISAFVVVQLMRYGYL